MQGGGGDGGYRGHHHQPGPGADLEHMEAHSHLQKVRYKLTSFMFYIYLILAPPLLTMVTTPVWQRISWALIGKGSQLFSTGN